MRSIAGQYLAWSCQKVAVAATPKIADGVIVNALLQQIAGNQIIMSMYRYNTWIR